MQQTNAQQTNAQQIAAQQIAAQQTNQQRSVRMGARIEQPKGYRGNRSGFRNGLARAWITCAVLAAAAAAANSAAAYNSEEHKLIGDAGASAVRIPAGVRFPESLNFQPVTPEEYRQWIKFAKRLSAGFDTNNPEDYDDSRKGVQDNYYSRSYGQLKYNLKIWVPPPSAVPRMLINVPTHCGPLPAWISFGELVALYGDYRRAVYSFGPGLCALTDVDLQTVRFGQGSFGRAAYAPAPLAGHHYLRAIGSGLVPPFGKLGNLTGYTAGPLECSEAGWWGDEMVRIAGVNDFHFSSCAVTWYIGLHRLALYYADKARDDPRYWINALHCEACGLHALTDLFAFGHVVVNRDISSYTTHRKSDTLQTPTVLWMENVIRLGGGVRGRDGKLALTAQLPAIADVPTSRFSTMAWNPGTTGVIANREREYHNRFNESGAVVKNLAGMQFQIHGDGRLRDTPRVLTVAGSAVTASLQSLLDGYAAIQSGQATVETLGRAGSPLFRALQFLPVYVESDPDGLFLGQFTGYARHIDALSGARRVPAGWERCRVHFVDGYSGLPQPRGQKCTDF